MSARCAAPLLLAELVAWERGDLGAEDAERVEEHFFACADCTKRLETLTLLAAGIRDLVETGGLPTAVTGDLVARAGAQGLKLRTYRLAPGQSVGCTAGPVDDFIVLRLSVAVEENESVDLVADIDDLESGAHEVRRTEDLLVDRDLGEIVYLYPGDMIRALPRSRWSLQARVRGPGGERQLGPYVLDHTPWEQLTTPPGR